MVDRTGTVPSVSLVVHFSVVESLCKCTLFGLFYIIIYIQNESLLTMLLLFSDPFYLSMKRPVD